MIQTEQRHHTPEGGQHANHECRLYEESLIVPKANLLAVLLQLVEKLKVVMPEEVRGEQEQ